MKKIMVLLIVLALMIPAVPVLAQEGNGITIGETVTGDITNEAPEVVYTFEGEAGQGIAAIAELPFMMKAFMRIDGIDKPAMAFSVNVRLKVGIFAILPETGVYTLVLGRLPDDDKVGPFQLQLQAAPVMTVGTPVEGQTTLEENQDYVRASDFALFAPAEDGNFTLSYSAKSDDPVVFLHMIDSSRAFADSVWMFETGRAFFKEAGLSGTANFPMKAGTIYIFMVGSNWLMPDGFKGVSYSLQIDPVE